MDNTSLFFYLFDLNNKVPFLSQFMVIGSQYIIYLAFILMLVLAVKGTAKERKALVIAVISLIIAVVLIIFIHIFITEQRPFVQFHIIPLVSEKSDLSFPSRHATIMAVVAFAYFYYKSKWTSLFMILMIWVGISRVFVGVHFPIDVIGGFMVGAISVLITDIFKKTLKSRLVLN